MRNGHGNAKYKYLRYMLYLPVSSVQYWLLGHRSIPHSLHRCILVLVLILVLTYHLAPDLLPRL